MYGRHGESPLPIVAAYSPSHCFDAAIEAARIALKYRTPVILLSDGYLANGAEPWLLPDVDTLPDITVPFATEPNHERRRRHARVLALPPRSRDAGPPVGHPGHARACSTASAASRRRTAPATSATTPENHEKMVHLRAAKIAGIADDIPPVEVAGDDDAELLVLGWGSTWGAIDAAVERVRRAGPARWRGPTSSTSTRCPPTSATCCAATRRSSCPS